MIRPIVAGVVLSFAALAAVAILSHRGPLDDDRPQRPAVSRTVPQGGAARRFRSAGRASDPDPQRAELARRVAQLEARLAEEATVRRRLEERFAEVAARLAALAGPGRESTDSSATSAPAPGVQVTEAGAAPNPNSSDAAGTANAVDYTKSPMERALLAAGLDEATAAEMKRRRDALTMKEMMLRDRATREQWLDSPRFAEEKAAIDAERTPIREELGDDAYDRYLFALGQTNRVRVDEVMAESPAAEAGLQAGDMILRYGDKRVFEPGELVAETRGGTLGESVPLEIVRNGERLEIEVPRGPLGLRIATAQDAPGAT